MLSSLYWKWRFVTYFISQSFWFSRYAICYFFTFVKILRALIFKVGIRHVLLNAFYNVFFEQIIPYTIWCHNNNIILFNIMLIFNSILTKIFLFRASVSWSSTLIREIKTVLLFFRFKLFLYCYTWIKSIFIWSQNHVSWIT